MVCLGFELRAAGWKAQTNPLSYGGTPKSILLSDLTNVCRGAKGVTSKIEF